MQTAEQLVGDGSGGFGQVFGVERVCSVGAQNGDDITGLGVGDACDIYNHLIHADISYNMCFLSTDQDRDFFVGETSWQAVSVADGNGGNTHGGLRPEVAPVADGFPLLKLFDYCNPGVEREYRTQRDVFGQLRFRAAVAAIHGDTETGVGHREIRIV